MRAVRPKHPQGKPLQRELGEPEGVRLPPVLEEAGNGAPRVSTPEALREWLTDSGFCRADHPGVTLELYGGLRLKTGCDRLPLRAARISDALLVLRKVYPKADVWLPAPPELAEHYRFSINGHVVTNDLSHPLQEDDTLILFSASVGG